MKEYTKEEIKLFQKIKKLGVKFEPSDDWHGAYYIPHHDKVFSWADGEDKPGQIGEPVWLGEISDCLEFFEKRDYQVEIKRVSDSWFIEIWKIGHKAESIKEWTARLLETCLKAVLAVLVEERK